MEKAVIGTYYKTYKGAYNQWNKKEKLWGRGRFGIIYSKKPRGYLVVSNRQLENLTSS